ncbi:MAG: hypothetical protein ABJA78_18950 [Ferruginibacter sp.]
MSKTLLLTLATALLIIVNFINVDINATAYSTPPYDGREKFNPALSSLNTVDKLDAYVSSVTTEASLTHGTVEYVEAIKNVISERFYHGFSHLSVSQNWVAALAEKVAGYGLSCNVTPEEILKHPYAACSQQCIVLMEMLRRRNIDYRSVGFPHHYTLETKLQNKWYYYDPNMEPAIPNSEREESRWKDSADYLKKYYDTTRFKDLDYKFGNHLAVTFGVINERPGPNAKRFQSATGIFAKFAWCIPFFLLIFRFANAFKRKYSFSNETGFIQSLWLILSGKQKYKLS